MNINGLEGRMLKYPQKKNPKQEILFIYGLHSSLEQYWGLIQVLHDLGSVTVPDLPGFGGMSSFYKIGKKPSLDNLADYLASFVRMQYKKRPVIYIGMGFGFIVITRMLQKYPAMTKNVKLVISLAGYADHDDFKMNLAKQRSYLVASNFSSTRISALILRKLLTSTALVRYIYPSLKLNDSIETEDYNKIIDQEKILWQKNDLKTYMFVVNQLLSFTNCERRVNLMVWHLIPKNDRFLDHARVEQHIKIVFKDYRSIPIKANFNIPFYIKDKKQANLMLPKELKKAIKAL